MRLKKVTIIGAGLMGGSLALALRKKRVAKSVWVLARNKKRARQIRGLKVFTRVTTDLKAAVKGADLVVLATPVSKKGAKFAQSNLFEDSFCIITPIKRNRAFKQVVRLWRKVGAKVTVLKASKHDEILAYLSGLPHLVSFSLTQTLPLAFAKFAAGSFKDLTRISSSSGLLWTDIFLSNAKQLKGASRKFTKNMDGILFKVTKKKRASLLSALLKINKKQRRIIQ
jgi:prephenate dehydrogenase